MRNKKMLMTVAILCVAIVSIFSFAACSKPIDTSSDAAGIDIYNVNGYQQAPADIAAITKDGAKIVPIKDMLNATGLNIKNSEDATAIAANIYHMIVRNAANTIGTGYEVATNASVAARGVKAGSLLGIGMDYFDVGLRSTYSSMDGPQGSFSQTVSGVTKLELEGLGDIGEQLKSMFGYNIQHFRNGNYEQHRNGGNGGAKFYNFEEKYKAEAPKLILGATVGKNVKKAFPTNLKVAGPNDGLDASKKWYGRAITAKATAAPVAADTYTNVWDPLHENEQGEIVVDIFGDKTTYTLGNMGCGWALYNFNKEWLDPTKTSVTYDKKTDVYTIKMSIVDDTAIIDEACKFAKSNLIKDTKNYVVLQNPKYTKLENTIQVHGCGLIKSWERDELMESTEQGYLTVFAGGVTEKDYASGGGSTGNVSISVFSYNELDYNAERMAALYWPELGDSKIMSKGNFEALDLSKYPNYDNYVPLVNGKPYQG